jgi:outer membrane protein assembly factor BamC
MARMQWAALRAVSLCVVLLLGACAGAPAAPETLRPPLVIPPGLSPPPSDEDASLGALSGGRYSESLAPPNTDALSVATLPEPLTLKLDGTGAQHWLVVETPAERAWGLVRDFFAKNGLRLVLADPKRRIMETAWTEKDALHGLLGPDVAGRHRFRVRLEEGATPASTEIYLSARADQAGATIADPDTETRMLRSLMVQLGGKPAASENAIPVSTPVAGARLKQLNQSSVLIVPEDFDRSWRRVGLALDQSGSVVEERDRSKGIYYVRYNNNQGAATGFWARLVHGQRGSRYRVEMKSVAEGVQVRVLGDQQPAAADRLLEQLYQQLK